MHVVGAAIVRDGRVLAARRLSPVAGWEFPGGKVEPGETEPAAVQREIGEELGVQVAVGQRLGEVTDGRIRLALYATSLVGGEPAAQHDHDELRWLAPGEIAGLDWLPVDRLLLDLVRNLLL